jgi:hypothetical protein
MHHFHNGDAFFAIIILFALIALVARGDSK